MGIGRHLITALALILAAALSARATVPVDGRLTAERVCPALSSIKRQTNPGNVYLQPDQTYAVVGKNSDSATHYLIRLPGASPAERWVGIDCGSLGQASEGRQASDAPPASVTRSQVAPNATPPPGEYVLAVSWLPAFCEAHRQKTECRPRALEGRDALRFTLHGLWPQPRDRVYCGVAASDRELSERGTWSRLAPLSLAGATRRRLAADMPGSLSYLQRHEWYKHGSCYGAGPDAYFRHSMDLLDQLNATSVRVLFEDNVGRHLSARRIRDGFDDALGKGAGARVRVGCDQGMITDLQIRVRGQVDGTAALADLVQSARPVSGGCRGGRVDAVGFD